MKLAYADPPYLGQGDRYGYPEWNELERHAELIQELGPYDGWAMSASSPSLKVLLPLCPDAARVAAWAKSFCAFKRGVRPCYAWEPVIFFEGRNPPLVPHKPPEKGGKQNTPKDFLVAPITLKKGLTGAKPLVFCEWVLDLLNAQPGDEVHDLFPGTGIMATACASRDIVYVSHRQAVCSA